MNKHNFALSLGTNLGNRIENLDNALAALKRCGVEITKTSSVYESAPWGVTDQPNFFNICAEVYSTAEPVRLLTIIKEIEKNMGRVCTRRWGPRLIDIDIIFCNDIVLQTEELTIPHINMHRRAFVLLPLMEIMPDRVHPIIKKNVTELYRSLKEEEKEGMVWLADQSYKGTSAL